MRLQAESLIMGLTLSITAVSAGEEAANPPASTPSPVSHVAGKKLIRVGSELCSRLLGAPSMAEADLPAKVPLWQDRGLDGLVFSMASHGGNQGPTNMTGQWWNLIPRSYEEFVPEIAAFRAVPEWGRLTDNFLWSSIAIWGDHPEYECQDWFNDRHWDVLLANVRLQARIAQECGFKGILLDVEQYAHHGQGPWRFPFNYPHYAASGYPLAGESEPRPLAECVAQVRERARQYAEAICEAYPGLTLFLIPALYRPHGLLEEEILFAPFVDGLLLGLDEKARLVAGMEITYLDSQYPNMLVFREEIRQQWLARSGYPERVREKTSLAVGLWTDGGEGPPELRFSDTDASVNQRDPERHRHAVHNALAASDEYAWLYGERSFYLTPEPTPLMREYFQATLAGRQPQDLHWEPVPKWDLTDYSGYESAMAAQEAAFWAEREQEGYRVAVALPVFWHFFFDVEQLGRSISEACDHSAWPLISTLKCWQSQCIRANGSGVYRIRFDAPADLDPARQEIVLACGGFSPERPEVTGWTIVRLNGKGYPLEPLVDVSESIQPGRSNLLVVQVINKSGPAGLLGHVKLLTRTREK